MNCKMDVRHVGDHECINCAKCMDVCRQDAISMKAGKITLIAPDAGCADDRPDSAAKRERGKKIAWAIAIAVLAFALLWYNVLDKTEQPDDGAHVTPGTEDVTDGDYGYAPGYTLADFTIECMDGQAFHLEDTRGKVTFINLWATYCGPCVEELPYFNELAGEHADDVAVLAVHNSMSKDDIPAYLADKGWDNIHFALDTNDKLVWNAVGGSAAMPQTIVLDRDGKVIYNQVGSVTGELLASLYDQASSGGNN